MHAGFEPEMLRGAKDIDIGERRVGPGKLMAQLLPVSRHVVKARHDKETHKSGVGNTFV